MTKPTPQRVTEYANSIGYDLDGEEFCDFYKSKGWLVGKSPMKDWEAAIRTWKRRSVKNSDKNLCVIDHKPASKFQTNSYGKKIYLCDRCHSLMGGAAWGKRSKSEIEKVIMQGKQRPKAIKRDPAMDLSDKVNEMKKQLADKMQVQ